ncbi:hypothetical protein Anapl_00966 [Anas platyrhynchos]|uniref:Uncharacterized protein n=1 Tax=Anas platyrhynchos TaxID=8839 RepID=R0JXM4_ANAPL|nr:hypothetical protein Anapl_00966 [Anas platyrhynchos]
MKHCDRSANKSPKLSPQTGALEAAQRVCYMQCPCLDSSLLGEPWDFTFWQCWGTAHIAFTKATSQQLPSLSAGQCEIPFSHLRVLPTALLSLTQMPVLTALRVSHKPALTVTAHCQLCITHRFVLQDLLCAQRPLYNCTVSSFLASFTQRPGSNVRSIEDVTGLLQQIQNRQKFSSRESHQKTRPEILVQSSRDAGRRAALGFIFTVHTQTKKQAISPEKKLKEETGFESLRTPFLHATQDGPDIAGINSFILQLASERCWLGHSTAPHRPARIDIIAGRSQYQQVHMADRIQNVLKYPSSAFSVLRETPKALGGTASPGKPRRAADLPASVPREMMLVVCSSSPSSLGCHQCDPTCWSTSVARSARQQHQKEKLEIGVKGYIHRVFANRMRDPQPTCKAEQAGPRHLRQEEISTPNTEQHEDELGKAALHLQQGTAGRHCRDTKNPLIARLSIQQPATVSQELLQPDPGDCSNHPTRNVRVLLPNATSCWWLVLVKKMKLALECKCYDTAVCMAQLRALSLLAIPRDSSNLQEALAAQAAVMVGKVPVPKTTTLLLQQCHAHEAAQKALHFIVSFVHMLFYSSISPFSSSGQARHSGWTARPRGEAPRQDPAAGDEAGGQGAGTTAGTTQHPLPCHQGFRLSHKTS